MKYLIASLMLIAGCGDSLFTKQANCTVSSESSGSLISCPDGTASTVHNGDSIQGKAGSDGKDGLNGANGANGADGSAGLNGHSAVVALDAITHPGCTVIMSATDINDSGTWELSDSNQQSALVCDGADAPPSQFTPVSIVDPCGTKPNTWNEVFLQLYDGSLLASFSDNASGLNTRFSLITPGNYVTSDGDMCYFTITADPQPGKPNQVAISNEHH